MRNRYLAVLMTALLLLPGTNGWSAQDDTKTDGQCLSELQSKVHQGEWLRITAHDGDRFEGSFRSIDFALSQLTMKPIADTALPGRAYQFDEIAKLQYRETGKIKPGYLLGGLFLGAIAGSMIGSASAGSSSNDSLDFGQMEAAFTGAAVGAGMGLILGTALSLSTPSTCTIRCK